MSDSRIEFQHQNFRKQKNEKSEKSEKYIPATTYSDISTRVKINFLNLVKAVKIFT